MDAFFISAAVVALAEFGDKTQLLAIVLAARFRAPIPILAGIATATLANHFAAGWVGTMVADWFPGDILRWVVGVSFLAVAAWALVPDTFEDKHRHETDRWGAFLATTVAFFLVEIGDKTQIATVTLAARFHDLPPVVLGTTVGMLIADGPAIWFGERIQRLVPMRLMRLYAAGAFLLLGVLALLGIGF